MADVRRRLATRVQKITTDGHKAYLVAVEDVDEAFGADVDYAQLVNLYGRPTGVENERRYSPAECIGIERNRIEGDPDPNSISTYYVERHNLSIRIGNRRFTRLTNSFPKKIANYISMLSLYFAHYNFCRVHKTLRCTPAQEAGLVSDVKNMEWIVGLIDAQAPKPGKRSLYKKRGAENSNWDTTQAPPSTRHGQ